ncbi:DUF1491 family protein [Alsobacter sp. R-9]
MGRLRSDVFVSAYLRRCAVDGAYAVLRRRGAAEAGAIFVKVDRLDGHCALYGPAPQSLAAEDDPARRFVRLHDAETIDPATAEERLAREVRFDSDLWIVEVEDRRGEARLELAEG